MTGYRPFEEYLNQYNQVADQRRAADISAQQEMLKLQETQRQQQQQEAFLTDWKSLSPSAQPEEYLNVMQKNPAFIDQIQKMAATMDTTEKKAVLDGLNYVTAAAEGGKIGTAANGVKRLAEFSSKIGDTKETKKYEEMFQDLSSGDPAKIAQTLKMIKAVAIGIDPAQFEKQEKAKQSATETEFKPAELLGKITSELQNSGAAVTNASTGAVNATTNASRLQNEISKQGENEDFRAKQLQHEADKLKLEQRKVDNEESGVKAVGSATYLKQTERLNEEAKTSQALANQMRGLAQKFDSASSKNAGWIGDISEISKNLLGKRNELSELNSRLNSIKAAEVLKYIPKPGSDLDLKMGYKGVPPENASKEEMSSWLKSMADKSQIISDVNSLQLKWNAAVFGQPVAKNATEITGPNKEKLQIKSGQTFPEFIKDYYDEKEANPSSKSKGSSTPKKQTQSQIDVHTILSNLRNQQ